MRVSQRYIYRQILLAVLFVSIGFLALFFFFDTVSELGWRLGMGLAALNLVLLAVASTNLNVRSSRSGGVLLALMIFVIYYNLLNYASDYISMDKAGMLPTLLVLHGGVFLFALLWLYKRQQQWTLGGWLRRRGARAEVAA